MTTALVYKPKDNQLAANATNDDAESWLTKLTMAVESSDYNEKYIKRFVEITENKSITILGNLNTINHIHPISIADLAISANDDEIKSTAELIKFSTYVYQVIYHSLSSELAKQFKYITKNDGLGLIRAIKQNFNSLYSKSQYVVRQELIGIKQNINEFISQFWSRVQILRSELLNSLVDPLLVNNKNLDQEIQSYVIKGLLPIYQEQAKIIVRSKIDNNNNIIEITTEELIARLGLYERQINDSKSNETQSNLNSIKSTAVLAASTINTNNNQDRKDQDQRQCTFCKKSGHLANRCFRNPENPYNKINKNKFIQCNLCNDKRPHSTDFCLTTRDNGNNNLKKINPQVSGFMTVVATTIESNPSSIANNACAGFKTVVDSKYFSDNIYTAVNTENKSVLILDSGATDHFIRDKSLFVEFYRMNNPISIAMANEKIKSTATHRGTVKFYANNILVILNDVIYVPDFKVNLISVSKLTELDILVSFNKSKAILTSGITGKIILGNKLSNGLFIIPISPLSYSNDYENTKNNPILYNANANEDNNNNKLTQQLWHNRCGHLSIPTIRKLTDKSNTDELNKVIGLNGFKHNPISETKCEDCLIGKSNRKPFSNKSSAPPITGIMDKFVSDLCGPIKGTSVDSGDEIDIPSLSGKLYLILIIDDYSGKYFGDLLKYKSDSIDYIIPLIKRLQNSMERKLKQFHSDGGGEFEDKLLSDYFKDNGTNQSFTTAGTPQHNGKAERAMRTLFEMCRSMLSHCKLPFTFWGAAILAAIYIRNRTILIRDTDKTSEELFTNNKPTIGHFKVFGCNAFVHQLKEKRTKLENKTKPGIMIGYDEQIYYYKIFMIDTGDVIISRDVDFNESVFTHAEKLNEYSILHEQINYQSMRDYKYKSQSDNDDDEDYIDNSYIRPQLDDDQEYINDLDIDEVESDPNIILDNSNNNHLNQIPGDNDNNINNSNSNIIQPNNTSNSIPMVRFNPIADVINNKIKESSRIVISSDRAKYFKDPTHPTYEEQLADETRQMLENENKITNHNSNKRSSNRISKVPHNPNSINTGLYDEYTQEQIFGDNQSNYTSIYAYMTTLGQKYIDNEPNNYYEAIQSEDSDSWDLAMKLEYNSLLTNNTWSLVELPIGRKAIKCKWVYTIKLDSNGNLDKYKARFVAKGFTQKYGIDYHETFAPVMKYTSLRIILAIACIRDYEIKQFDVESAFLHATVKEEIYVEQPQGFVIKGKENLVCKLNKSLYGLKQASKDWNHDINNTIVFKLFYIRSINDQCVYYKQSKTGHPMILGLFVDDILSIYSKEDENEWVEYKNIIKSIYKIKDLGDAKWILKMRIQRDRNNRILTLDQEPYINKIINKFNMSDAGINITTPACNSIKLSTEQCPKTNEDIEEMKSKPYLQLIGSLLYASISTRIDISYIVAKLTRFNKNPGKIHWEAAKRVVRYLKGNIKSKLLFRGNNSSNELIVSGYSDSDWAGDIDDKKSTTGYIIKLNNCPISWLSKKQEVVATSSCEAELLALATITKEIIWTRNFIDELTLNKNLQIQSQIWCDNQSTIQIAANDNTSGRTKHISIRYHFIKDYINDKSIQINWIGTNEQQADILTKPLAKVSFNNLKMLLMN